MGQRWLFLRVSGDLEVAVELSQVHRVLHRNAPEYPAFAAQAVALDRVLGEEPDRTLPGVVVVLESGSSWYTGDAGLSGEGVGLAYHPIPPDLLSASPAWCRGVLAGGGHWAYLVDPRALEALHG